MSTLAEYNNNPGNLRPPAGVKYDGQIGVDENGFAIFENKDYGRRALINDIEIKLKRGLNSPDKFIERYAPRGDENPQEAQDNYKIWLAGSLGLESTNAPFPKDSAEKIADAVAQFESGTWGKPPAAAPSSPSAEETSGQLTDQQRRDKLTEEIKALPGKIYEEYPTASRVAIDAAGAALGSQASRFTERGRERVAQAATDLLRSSAKPVAPAVQPAATPPAPIPTDPMHTRQLQGTTDAGATGRARQQTYNVGTSQQAAAANEQAKVIEQLKRQGIVTGDAKSLLAKAPGLTSTPSGVLLPSSQVYADVPPTQGTTPPPPPEPPQPRQPSPLSRGAQAVSRGVNIGYRAFPGAAGALAGLGMADLGQQAYSRFSEGDVPGGILASVGAGSSALSLFPFPVTRVPSTLLAVASPLALLAYDKMKERAVSQAQGYGALAAGRQLPAPSIYSGFTNP
jgi:hypothetical protein